MVQNGAAVSRSLAPPANCSTKTEKAPVLSTKNKKNTTALILVRHVYAFLLRQ